MTLMAHQSIGLKVCYFYLHSTISRTHTIRVVSNLPWVSIVIPCTISGFGTLGLDLTQQASTLCSHHETIDENTRIECTYHLCIIHFQQCHLCPPHPGQPLGSRMCLKQTTNGLRTNEPFKCHTVPIVQYVRVTLFILNHLRQKSPPFDNLSKCSHACF